MEPTTIRSILIGVKKLVEHYGKLTSNESSNSTMEEVEKGLNEIDEAVWNLVEALDHWQEI